MIGINRVKTWLLIATLAGLFVAVGALLGGGRGATIALGLALVFNFVMYWSSDRIAIAATRSKPVTEAEAPDLYAMVRELAVEARAPMPRIYVSEMAQPNAFATGRNPEHASIAVTDGLLKTLNRVELEGVIAHELSHVKNRDILVGTLTATLVGVVVLLAGWMRWGLFWGGGRGRGRGGGGGGNPILLIVALVAMILAPLAAQLIRFAVSRRREYLADADGALLTRYPPGLASALRKIGSSTNTMRVANNATAHLWFNQPSRAVGEGHSRIEQFFSTHPPIEERIKALEEM